MATRHFLTLLDLSPDELRQLLNRAIELKAMHRAGEVYEPLKNKVLAMIFEKSSTRTRVSFEAGMVQLGGHAMFLSPRDTQLGRGEPIEDTARVLSSMVDIIMVRTFEHEKIQRLADYSSVPVINGLTDWVHPCQLLADMQTYQEHRGEITGRTVTYVGDGNNMCHSYINAARQFGFKLRIACPAGYDPDKSILSPAGDQAEIVRAPHAAAKDADLVVTDVWASMGQEEEQASRQKAFAGYYVDEDLSDPSQPPTFPAYAVGPHSIAGKHLYEFKPDEPPQIPGHNRYWPTDNWFGEIYSGILRSRSLPGGLDLAAGKYKIKLEVFDGSGNRVAPSPGTFRFIVPTGVASDGVTILSRNAYASEIEDDGFIFYLHIDNRSCDAVIDGPTANGTVADDACGFLRFGVGDQVSIAFHATHPANFAYFHFWIRRGIQIVSNVFDDVDAPSVASSTSPAHSYGGDGSGNFAKTNFTPGQLLDTCPEAAFAEILRTRAKATNGWHRLDAYDAGHERAFALAPKKP